MRSMVLVNPCCLYHLGHLFLLIESWDIACEISLRWVSLDHTDEKSTLVEVMEWCHQATSHDVSQCWPRSMSLYGFNRTPYVNIRWSQSLLHYTPRFNEVERGLYWFHLVRLSVCGQNRVRSVSSTILIGSISYLHILSSNFRNFVEFFKFVTLTLSSDLGSNMTQ